MPDENATEMTQPTNTPPPAPPKAPSTTPPSPKKRRTGCIVVSVILAFLLCCCLGTTAVAWPLISIYAGMAKPKPVDLGVRYSLADLKSISKKTGVILDTQYGKINAGTAMFYKGQITVNAVLTEAEFSAYLNYLNSPRFPIKEVQVKMKDNNKAEVSTLVTYQGRDYPVQATVSGTVKGNTASGSIQIIKIAGITIPAQYRNMITKAVLDLINSRLKRVTGLNIRIFRFSNGHLIIFGTLPAKAWRAKSNAGG